MPKLTNKLAVALLVACFFSPFGCNNGSSEQNEVPSGRRIVKPWFWWHWQEIVEFVGIPGKDGEPGVVCAYVRSEYDANLPDSLKAENLESDDYPWQLAFVDKWRLLANEEKTLVSAPMTEEMLYGEILDVEVRQGFGFDQIVGMLHGLRDAAVGAGQIAAGTASLGADAGVVSGFVLAFGGSAMIMNAGKKVAVQLGAAHSKVKPFEAKKDTIDQLIHHARDVQLSSQQVRGLVRTIRKLTKEYDGEKSCPSGLEILRSMMPQAEFYSDQ